MNKSQKPPCGRRLLPPIAALSAFEAVARTASFTTAAAELALSQSAISREIKSLEERLGVLLFTRTSQGVVLTPAAELYVHRVRELLYDLAGATTEVIAHRSRGGMLRLGILPTFGTRWLIPQMPDFFDKHPEIEVSFVPRPSEIFNFALEDLDATIYAGAPNWPGIKLVKLAEQEMIPVCAPSMAATLRGATDLLTATLLCYTKQQEAWSEWFAQASLDMDACHRLITFGTYQMVLQAAVTGLGVAIVPEIMVRTELSNNDLVGVCGPPLRNGRAIYMAYPNTKEHFAPVIMFRDWLLSRIDRTL
jgi:DNA-binding transcriptional LysR family regulator